MAALRRYAHDAKAFLKSHTLLAATEECILLVRRFDDVDRKRDLEWRLVLPLTPDDRVGPDLAQAA